jgi:hypothetical protein
MLFLCPISRNLLRLVCVLCSADSYFIIQDISVNIVMTLTYIVQYPTDTWLLLKPRSWLYIYLNSITLSVQENYDFDNRRLLKHSENLKKSIKLHKQL